MRRDHSFIKWNLLFFILPFIGFIFAIFLRLFYLQVLNGASYRNESDTNITRSYTVRASRGVIYDSQNIQLVTNVPSWRVVIDLKGFEGNMLINLDNLSAILDIVPSEIEQKINSAKEQGIEKLTIKDGISKDETLHLSSVLEKLQGVELEENAIRNYPYSKVISHMIGYTGEVNDSDIEGGGFLAGDIVGKEGIEYQYDRLLRGVDGERRVVIDVAGNIKGEESVISPRSGSDIKLSISIAAQNKLYELLSTGLKDLDANGAAAMIMNIHTGEIIAAVSVPSYDNNLFAKGISTSDYNQLLNDPSFPLLNRYISMAQPPGSTMKTVTATAGLDSGSITKSTIYESTGVFYLGGYQFQEYQRHVYGPLNVIGALSKSSNIFFYNTVLKMGMDNFKKYADLLGLGQKTGIDIPGEIDGVFSSPEYKCLVSDEPWYPGDSLNSAIGQGYNMVTPIQMLRWISAIANDGTLVTPHFLTEYKNKNGEWGSAQYDLTNLPINKENLAIVREGMRSSVATGIVYTLRDCKIPVAAKTGTAEFGVKNEKGEYTKTHAWITGFYPYESPEYAFVFFQEAGGLGAELGKLAKEFINWQVAQNVN